MTHKKLGLLLLPLVPLTAIGIVEVANEVVSLNKPAVVAVEVTPVAPKRVERIAPPATTPPIEAGPQPTVSL